MAPHSSTLAWKIPWTEEPGRLQTMGSQRVGHNWSDLAAAAAAVFHWWRRQWHATPVLLPGKSHGRRNLAGCSPWGRVESDTTERLHFHFSLSCIGEGNGNPLQCSCLENPRDGGAWWAAVYGSHRVGHDWSDLAAAGFHRMDMLLQLFIHLCLVDLWFAPRFWLLQIVLLWTFVSISLCEYFLFFLGKF